MMELTIGQKVCLPVKNDIESLRKPYYVVTAPDGKEYMVSKFKFQQQSEENKSELRCIVKDIINGQPLFWQDFSYILPNYYTEGNTYKFTVRLLPENNFKNCYKIEDDKGIFFNLQYNGLRHLRVGQEIKCRVKCYVKNIIKLEYIDEQTEKIIFITPEELSDYIDVFGFVRKKLIEKITAEWTDIDNMVYECNPEWLQILLGHVNDKFYNVFFKPGKEGKCGCERNNLLQIYRSACLYLIEESGMLSEIEGARRKAIQKSVIGYVRRCDSAVAARDIIERSKAQEYVSTFLSHLQSSGFIYEGKKRLGTVYTLLFLESGLFESVIKKIFQVVLDKPEATWKTDEYKEAIIEIMNLYVSQHREHLDHLEKFSDKNKEDMEMAVNVVTALSIVIYLTDNDQQESTALHRSMLYRYLTYFSICSTETNREKLILNSLYCISGFDRVIRWYNWTNIRNTDMMALNIVNSLSSHENVWTDKYYDNGSVRLSIKGDNVDVSPSASKIQSLYDVIPEGFMTCPMLSIRLPKRIERKKLDKSDMNSYLLYWNLIESALFDTGNEVVANDNVHKAKLPDDNYVDIIVEGMVGEGKYLCRICEEGYEGSGYMNLKDDVVDYNVYGAGVDIFCDSSGNPCKFKADVLSEKAENYYHFSIRKDVNDLINFNAGREYDAYITFVHSKNYLGVTREGLPVSIRRRQNDGLALKAGDYVKVRYMQQEREHYIVEYVDKSDKKFSLNDALKLIMSEYIKNYGETYIAENEDDDDNSAVIKDNMLTERYVKELLRIVDRRALLETSIERTFNYLALARLISRILHEDDNVEFYNNRLQMLILLQQFSINGSVNTERLNFFGNKNENLLRRSPQFRERFIQLQTLSYINHPEKNAELYAMLDDDMVHSKLARLVLAYNLIADFSMQEESKAILSTINEVLEIHRDDDPRFDFGDEGLRTEFKTSIVYPADNNMYKDLQKQTEVVMKVICSFMNTAGGKLFIGVNDQGYPSGISGDLREFRGDKDSYKRHIIDSVREYMGRDAGRLVDMKYNDYGRHTVLEVDVMPSDSIVSCKSVVYERQDSESIVVYPESMERFKRQRETQYKSYMRSFYRESTVNGKEKTLEKQGKSAAGSSNADGKAAMPKSRKTVSEISTTSHRPNPTTWADASAYGNIQCFVHFTKDGKYMWTSDPDEENDSIDISLAVFEEDKYIVMVYENGNAVKVLVSDITNKNEGSLYARNIQSKLFFASPASQQEALCTRTMNKKQEFLLRVDKVEYLTGGDMNDSGEPLMSVKNFGNIVQCEIIGENVIENLDNAFLNCGSKKVGVSLRGYSQLSLLPLINAGIDVNAKK